MQLILIRGLPGSGKSTLADILMQNEVRKSNTCRWYEADMYFTDSDGNYNFQPRRIREAHAWCQQSVDTAMEMRVSTVIVSNTFIKQWEMKPYRQMAEEYGYKVVELIAHSDFESVNGVPDEVIDRMRRNFELDPE